MELFGSAEIEKGFVDGKGFHQGRCFPHHIFDLSSHSGVHVYSGADDHGVGAGFAGLKHGHGRMDTFDAGDIAAGRHHTPLAATDNDRLIAERRIIPFFDAGVESIAVDMGDSEAR